MVRRRICPYIITLYIKYTICFLCMHRCRYREKSYSVTAEQYFRWGSPDGLFVQWFCVLVSEGRELMETRKHNTKMSA